jgi:hypothetical protein
MTTLVAICGQPLVHALGWTLLHLCWQGRWLRGCCGACWECWAGGVRARYAAGVPCAGDDGCAAAGDVRAPGRGRVPDAGRVRWAGGGDSIRGWWCGSAREI